MLVSPQSAREGAQYQVSEQGQTSDRTSALLAQCSLYCPKQPEFLALSPWHYAGDKERKCPLCLQKEASGLSLRRWGLAWAVRRWEALWLSPEESAREVHRRGGTREWKQG